MLRGLIKFDDILMYQSTDVYHETTVKSRVEILNCMNMHYNVCSVYLLIMDVLCMHIHTGTYSLARDGGQRNGPQIHSTEHQRQLPLDVYLD